MKYIIRSIKYFLYLAFILIVVLYAMVAFKFTDGNIQTMFRNGYDSLWQIAGILAIFAATYPKFGYCTRKVIVGGSYSELRDAVVSVMERHKYRLEKEEGENMTFRLKSPVARIARVAEDRITLTRDISGFEIEGLTRDVVRLIQELERIPDQI